MIIKVNIMHQVLFVADGSSKFLAGNRWGVFWSVGGGWRFYCGGFHEACTELVR